MAIRNTIIPAYLSNVHPGQGLPPAELIDGACRTPKGLAIMDRYTDNPTGKGSTGSRAREDARILCGGCLVFTICHKWIMDAENPPGAWHGMYAAMTQAERKNKGLRREAERELLSA